MRKLVGILLFLTIIFLSSNAFAMKYLVKVEVYFENKQDATDLINYVESIKAKTWKPVGNETIFCNREARIDESYHDEIPPKQCKVGIENVDFSKEKSIH